MPRSKENLTPRRIILQEVETLAIGAIAAWSLLFPAKAGQEDAGRTQRSGRADNVPAKTAKPFPTRQADHAAAVLQRRVRDGLPVTYDANVGVEFRTHRPDGTPITETTIAPLEYKVGGDEEYFKLVGHSLDKLRVVAIQNPIDVVKESWDLQHGGVTVTSHGGVINTGTVDGTPVGPIHLSDGRTETVAIAQTSANP
jgi:hypothetical protein